MGERGMRNSASFDNFDNIDISFSGAGHQIQNQGFEEHVVDFEEEAIFKSLLIFDFNLKYSSSISLHLK